jgi:glycerol-3-phosphate dehydrogenase
MGGTKGSHIVLENPELLEATRGNEIFFEAADGRIVLIYPLKGRVMVGTTDIDADPREPTVCTDDEIDYFFDLIAQVFPHIAVDRSQIVYTFSGIRPPRHDDSRRASCRATTASRRAPRRPRAEPGRRQVDDVPRPRRAPVHEVLARWASAPVSTLDLAIGGGAGYPRTDADRAAWLEAHRGRTARAPIACWSATAPSRGRVAERRAGPERPSRRAAVHP